MARVRFPVRELEGSLKTLDFNVWALEPTFVFSLFFPSPNEERAVAVTRAVGPENKAE